MTQDSKPWEGTSLGDAGPYSGEEWRSAWKHIIGQAGQRGNVGPFLGSGTQPNDGLLVQAQAVPSGSVDVLPGSALVQGGFYLNDATVALSMAGNASGQTRIDTIILRADYVAQTVRLAVSQGTPAASPVPPTLIQTLGVLWEVPLADITLASGFTTIANAVIQPRHEWANAPAGVYLDNVLNNSGGVLNTGDVVVWDTATDRAVSTTGVEDSAYIAGTWIGRTANGAYGRVLRKGIGYVRITTASVTARGDLLYSYTTPKQATRVPITGSMGAVLGRTLEGAASGGPGSTALILAYIDVEYAKYQSYLRFLDQKANNTAPASLTLGAWRTRELTTKQFDSDGLGSLASNQITLEAGNYYVWATAQSTAAAGNGRLRIRDVSNGITLVQGNNIVSQSVMILVGFFQLLAQTVIELQHYPSATGNGGVVLNSGDVEVYAEVFLTRIGRYS